MDRISFVRLSNIFIAFAMISLFHPVSALSNEEHSYCVQNGSNCFNNEQIDMLKKGADAFYAKEYTKTISICNRIIFASPDYAPAYAMKGLAYSAKGDLDQAIKNLDRAISIDPDLASAWASKGIVLYSQNNKPEANACLQRALDLDSDFSIKWNRLATASMKRQTEPEYHASIAPLLIYGGVMLFGMVMGILVEDASGEEPIIIINNSTVINTSIASDNIHDTKPFSGINFTRETSVGFNTTANFPRP